MKKKIIIADDSELTHDIYKVFFSKYDDLEVIDCFNGLEAWDMLSREEGIRLILLDIEMPVMDGFQFLDKKNSNGRFRGIPVVVISWRTDNPENIRRAMEMGAEGCINKSEIEEINEHLKKALE